MEGREAPFRLHFENTAILWLMIMSDACERTVSSGGAGGGNVRRSRLLCSILVFKVATRTDLMYTIYLYPLPLWFEDCRMTYASWNTCYYYCWMSTLNRIMTEERTCSVSILYVGTLYGVIMQWFLLNISTVSNSCCVLYLLNFYRMLIFGQRYTET
jgi:hypothetical protein